MLETICEDSIRNTSRKRIGANAVELVQSGWRWYVRSQDDINRSKSGVALGNIAYTQGGASALLVRINDTVEANATLPGQFGTHVLTLEMPAHLILRGFGSRFEGRTLADVLTEGEYHDVYLHNCDVIYRKRGK